MWSTLVTLALTVLGFFIVLGLWFVIQAWFRWKSGCGGDRDLLEFMAHGCLGCKGPGSCSRKTTHSEHHYESL